MSHALEPDDIRRAARVAVEALQPLADADWSVRSGNGVAWDVRSTLLHIVGGLGFYGAQLASRETEEHEEPGIAPETTSDLCRAILDRLFPNAPTEGDPWAVLLWANGRGTIPGRDPLGKWTWHPEPLASSSET